MCKILCIVNENPNIFQAVCIKVKETEKYLPKTEQNKNDVLGGPKFLVHKCRALTKGC